MKKPIRNFFIIAAILSGVTFAQQLNLFDEKDIDALTYDSLNNEIESIQLVASNVKKANFTPDEKSKQTARVEKYLHDLKSAKQDRDFQKSKLTYQLALLKKDLAATTDEKAKRRKKDQIEDFQKGLEPLENGMPPEIPIEAKSKKTIKELKEEIANREKDLANAKEEDIESDSSIEPEPRQAWRDYCKSLELEVLDLKNTLKLVTKNEKTEAHGAGTNNKGTIS